MRRLLQAWWAVSYLVWLAWQVPKQAFILGRDVLTPGLDVSPSIIEFPLRARTTLEIAAIESSITITPGTLTLGVAEADEVDDSDEASPGLGAGGKSLFVHFLYAHTHEGAIAELADMESRILRVTRGREVALLPDPPAVGECR
ncbi:MAG TPA: Na+/H+ antiporter subunit E [Phycicoccus sp.]|jgi:multicomponent Na+:H+ antiporter subunit E|nr:Na+/H+ antiporter subunit E [Phycicoccus sp.]HQH07542.1 Na+/H+ antiporter subunit E [Phycicoccus sp.]HQK32168.1 Na+/H+ antiporter subunit E [Phycicoccus sp.]HQY96297.1 Na+/H+ antiporter subunit E [Phycicoccus sp.]HRA44383.1 Na+/H+ antiporter subunit E [Phycicoccus sp.]